MNLRSYQSVILLLDDDAREILELVETDGEKAALERLKALQAPGEGTLVSTHGAPWGDKDAIFEHGGVVTRFTRHEGSFFVETDDSEGNSSKFEVTGTVGIAPLQQYIVETEPGRGQVLDVAWDDTQKRWYHLYEPQATPSAPNVTA